MHTDTPAVPKAAVRGPLLREHARIDILFENLLGAYEEEDWRDVREAWDLLEAGLLAHLDAEEASLLSVFRDVDPEEAVALVSDHQHFREQLAALGVQIDLSAVSLDMARALVADLRAHAKREDGLLYDWAEWNLEPSARAAAVDRLMEAPEIAPRVRRSAQAS